MKKILSLISIFLVLNNVFIFNAFAAEKIDLQIFNIKINE
jgi:hypothetical protein